MNLTAYRNDMPWELEKWREHMGLDGLSGKSILHAVEWAMLQNEDTPMGHLNFKGMEMRSLAIIYPGPQFQPTLKRAETALKHGQSTLFGGELLASPWRWSATIQSILATNCRNIKHGDFP